VGLLLYTIFAGLLALKIIENGETAFAALQQLKIENNEWKGLQEIQGNRIYVLQCSGRRNDEVFFNSLE